MSKLIVSQDNEKIVLVDGTTIEIDTGMFNDPLGFIVTEAAQQPVAVDVANTEPCKHIFDGGLYCIYCGEALF